MSYEVTLQHRQPVSAAVIRFTAPPGRASQFLGAAYGEIGAYLHELGVEHEEPLVYARFLRFEPEAEVEAGLTVTAAVSPRGRVIPGQLPGGEVATTLHVGSYATLPAATAALRSWIAANGREPEGGPFEVYHDDPAAVPEADLRTEVFYALK